MFLKNISLRQFRSYPRLDLSLSPGLNVLIGPNGAGKSNFLEAVSVLATGASHRDADGKHLFLRDAEGFALIGAFGGEEDVNLESRQERGRPRQVRLNNVFQKRMRDWLGRVPLVSFSPEDLDLVKGEPSVRRRAINDILFQGGGEYADVLQRYNKTVEERGAALRAVQEGRAGTAVLEPWDLALLKDGALLTTARRDFVVAFSGLVAERHRTLSGGRETVRLAYKPSFLVPLPPARQEPSSAAPRPGEAAEIAAANRRRLSDLREGEIAAGASLIGPHRDDLEIFLSGPDGPEAPARAFASQGQQRTLAIAFKLAERVFLRSVLGREPICVLDDMLSELDGPRREGLRPFLFEGGQCFLTMTSLEDWRAGAAETAVFDVSNGRVAPLSGRV